MPSIAHVPPGDYTVRELDSNGVPIGTPVNVTVEELTANIVEVDPTADTPLTLNTNAPPGTFYQWTKNGDDIPGATLPPPYTPTGAVAGDQIRCRLTAPNQPAVTTDPVTIAASGAYLEQFTGTGSIAGLTKRYASTGTIERLSDRCRIANINNTQEQWLFPASPLDDDVWVRLVYTGAGGSVGGATLFRPRPTLVDSVTGFSYDVSFSNIDGFVRVDRRPSGGGSFTNLWQAVILPGPIAIGDVLGLRRTKISGTTIRVRAYYNGAQIGPDMNDTSADRLQNAVAPAIGAFCESVNRWFEVDDLQFGIF